jgi:hypothetical protein
LATSEFKALSELQARAMGYPNLRIVTIQHPLGGMPADEAILKAQDAANSIKEMIIGY